jgi:hypothetical protein
LTALPHDQVDFTTKAKLFIAGFAVAGAVAVAYAMFFDEPVDDDDRPPIIVRNGSLIFENGDGMRPGKPWKEITAGNETWWRMDHPKGHWPGYFDVSFNGGTIDGTNPCPTAYSPEITVYFQGEGDPYRVTKRPRNPNGNDKKLDPVVLGTGLTADNTQTYPRLTKADTEGIDRVVWTTGPNTSATCSGPSEAKIEIVR